MCEKILYIPSHNKACLPAGGKRRAYSVRSRFFFLWQQERKENKLAAEGAS
jgi:hypothetical protein